jgi:hypothetical protein
MTVITGGGITVLIWITLRGGPKAKGTTTVCILTAGNFCGVAVVVDVLVWSWSDLAQQFTLSGAYLQPGIPRLISPTFVTDIRVQDSRDSTIRPPRPSKVWLNHFGCLGRRCTIGCCTL